LIVKALADYYLQLPRWALLPRGMRLSARLRRHHSQHPGDMQAKDCVALISLSLSHLLGPLLSRCRSLRYRMREPPLNPRNLQRLGASRSAFSATVLNIRDFTLQLPHGEGIRVAAPWPTSDLQHCDQRGITAFAATRSQALHVCHSG
jgi:hypothetical protein